jgi:hypothetical protein
MEQLQQYWEIVKKYHFWILSGLAMLVPLAVAWLASGKLAKAYAEQKSKISSTSSALDPLTMGDHPNRQWVDHIHSETAAMRQNAYTAWSTLYAKQQALLKWPADLGADFIAAFSKPESADDPVALSLYLERYQGEVKNQLVQLAAKIRSKWAPASTNTRVSRAAEELDASGRFVCQWSTDDEQFWLKNYAWDATPTPLDVRYAQQDLWVMGAIFDCIARANAGATGEFDAVVRQVDRVLIGYDASEKYPLSEGSNRIIHLQRSTDNGIRGAAPSGGGAAPTIELKRPVPGTEWHPGPVVLGAPPPDASTHLKDGRYVDDDGKPITAQAMASPTNPEYLLLAFKLNLAVDEQRWQRLLTEFANSPFLLDVREVRVDPANTRDVGGAHRQDAGSTIHNVPVEIYGFAYIIQQPNPAALGGGGPDSGMATATGLPGATPPVAPTAGSIPAAAPTTVSPPTAPPGAIATSPATTPPITTAPTAAPPGAAPPGATPPVAAPAAPVATPAPAVPPAAPAAATAPK